MAKRNDRRELFRHLKSKKLAMIYYVHGPDVFMLDSAVKAIVAAAAPEGLNDFNHEKFSGKDATGEKVLSAVEQLPFMVDRRVVILRDVQAMPTSEFEALSDYFVNPSPTTVLIVHANTANKKLDGRTAVVKKLVKAAECFEFKPYYENELGDFVAMQSKRRSLALDGEASAYLIEAIGTDLGGIVSALDKLDLFIGVSENIRSVDGDTIRQVIANNRVHNVFALTDTLGARNLKGALIALQTMMHAGEPAIKIVSMIARHFRILAKLQDPDVAVLDRGQKARAAGVAPYFLNNYQRDAQRFSRHEVTAIRKQILETDYALKSSRLDAKTIVETLVWNICFRTQAQRSA